MRYAIVLVVLAGCSEIPDIDRPGIIAELAVRYAAVITNPPKAPTPDKPREGCVEGCKCNGTGKEKSGDGLAVVSCRCDDDCSCKRTPQNARSEPKMVPVPQKTPEGGHLECRDGVCYWVDDATGARYRVVK